MNGFKETEIGLIPEDWEVIPILDCCIFERGREVGSKNYNSEGKGVPFIRVGNIAKGLQELVYTTCKKVKLCKKEDILIALDGSPGAVARGWEGAYASGIRKVLIKPNWKNKLDYNYLYFILQHPIVQNVIKTHATGVTILHASKSLQHIKIPLPPLEEQKKIAKVLDKIQQAIEIQDKIIKQVENLKKSLMQKLFTEGLNGEEQKETEIGLIPKSWEVVRLGEIFEVQQGKQLSRKKKVKGLLKCPFLRTSNILWGRVILDNLDTMFASEREIKKLKIKKGDIFVCEGGDVGRTAILEEDIDFDIIFQNHLHRLRPKTTNNIIPKFFVYWMEKFIRLDKSHIPANITTIPNLSSSRLKSFLIPLPPLEEQKQIAHILSVVDKKIEVEKKRKEVLKNLFKTTLHKLMTGEIRLKEVEV